jgi:hypothetical protein
VGSSWAETNRVQWGHWTRFGSAVGHLLGSKGLFSTSVPSLVLANSEKDVHGDGTREVTLSCGGRGAARREVLQDAR